MSSQLFRGGCFVTLLGVVLAAASTAKAVDNAGVDTAIANAKAYLYAHENQGNWELIPVGNFDWAVCAKPDGGQFGGPTALATYALLASGELPSDPRIAQAIDWLQKADCRGTYALGLRCQVWNLLPRDDKYKANIAKDAKDLLASLKKKGVSQGMWNYLNDNQAANFDHSNSQYGVLGLWGCSECGLEIPDTTWKLMDDAWKVQQNADGGWSYAYKTGEPYDSITTMTAAGIATLFILQDELHGESGADCRGNIKNENIEKGLKWMEKEGNFTSIFGSAWPYYGLYGVERIGIAAGYRDFGNIDWYQSGAEFLLKKQQPDGSWGDSTWNTAFGLLFLVRGRAPVVMNKLDYEFDSHGDTPKAANWNQRPRDAANFTKWMSKEYERDFNWQVVTLKPAAEDLLDAPILYLSGNQPLSFSADDETKLKKYVQEGGLIYANADCQSANFADSFQRLGAKLFPEYKWINLPKTDVIYSEAFAYDKWKNKPTLMALDNGVRHLMVLSPTSDFSRGWQTRWYHGKEENFEMPCDLYFYAVDKQNMQYKGNSYVVVADKTRMTNKALKVARLQFTGNWDPEPGGWWRLAAILNNNYGVAVQVDPIQLGSGKLTNAYNVAHLTGTGDFTLDDTSKAELKKFIGGGGTLIVDSAGGNGSFSDSAEAALPAIFGAPLQLVAPSSPIFAANGQKIETFGYRAFAKKTLSSLHGPRLRAITVNNRQAVFFSGEDLSVGMVGNTVDGIIGYDSKTATTIMTDLLLYSTSGAGVTATTRPSADFKKTVVWDGDGAAGGKGWTFPADPQTTLQVQSVEVAGGKNALEFHHAGQAFSNMGWNWFGYFPDTGGTDITAFTNLSFHIKFKGETAPTTIAVCLSCSGTKQASAAIDLMKIAPKLADAQWHEIVIPVKDLLQGGGQFDPKKAWEIEVAVTSGAPQTFSLFLDDIGFDSRGATTLPTTTK